MASSHRPGLKEKLFFLTSGIIVSIPMAVFFESLGISLSDFFADKVQAEIFSVAVLAPLVEELAKAYPLFYRHGESQRSLFSLGLLVGLGFGITEFLEYVVLLNVSPLARLPGIFFHAALTSIVAYGIAVKRSTLFYLIAVLLHFSNNFLAVYNMPDLLFWLVLMTAILLSWTLYMKSSQRTIDY